MSLLFTVAMVIVVWAACAVGLPLLTPTNTASPQRRAPLATTAKRGKCMLTPFIGW
jgi:amino acid permease